MTEQDGNGQPTKRYVIVDHEGESFEANQLGVEQHTAELVYELPVGGRVTVTRVS